MFNLIARTEDAELISLTAFHRVYVGVRDTHANGLVTALLGGWVDQDAEYRIAVLNGDKVVAKVFKEIEEHLNLGQVSRKGTPNITLLDLREWVLDATDTWRNTQLGEPQIAQLAPRPPSINVMARTLEGEWHDLSVFDRLRIVDRTWPGGKATLICGGWIDQPDESCIGFCHDRTDAITCLNVLADAVSIQKPTVIWKDCMRVASKEEIAGIRGAT